MMPLQIGRKYLFYLLILFLLTTISNQNLTSNFLKIKKIDIVGLENIDLLDIKKKIIDLNLENIITINKSLLKNKIESNNLIENFEVFKNYPSTLKIKIEKTKFIARIKISDNFFLIGANGKLIKIDSYNKDLPFIFGNPSINEVLIFVNFINQSNFNYENLNNIYYFKSGRWDIETKDGKLFKLPKDNLLNILQIINKIYLNENFYNKFLIDMRINNQIIIND